MFEALSILENTTLFLLSIILFTIVYALASKSFIFSAYAGFLVFVGLAVETQFSILLNAMYILVVGMTVISAFQVFNLTQENTTGV